MDSISELALKGHFEELKKKFDRKGMVRAGNIQSQSLVNVIGKAVSMAEDIYEHDPQFFTDDHKEDYQLMINTLNELGYNYSGHPDLMEKVQPKAIFPKKPMQKAGRKETEEKKNRRAG